MTNTLGTSHSNLAYAAVDDELLTTIRRLAFLYGTRQRRAHEGASIAAVKVPHLSHAWCPFPSGRLMTIMTPYLSDHYSSTA